MTMIKQKKNSNSSWRLKHEKKVKKMTTIK